MCSSDRRRQIVSRRKNIIHGAQAVAWAVAGHRGEHTLCIHCPSSGSLGGLAVVADIMPDHDGAAEAFGSMT